MDRSWIQRTMMSGVRREAEEDRRVPRCRAFDVEIAVVVNGDLWITFRKPRAPLEVKIDGPRDGVKIEASRVKINKDRRTAATDGCSAWTG
ncbi:hypothetical protein B9Z55_005525 [Caenorhabditis nigoni]|uniref:Uncharacterized protein n=1 Tax=Caenorhabditis nigoni TaxID=1611254 RepID=A0A2G5V178_9PELO|nr:hypothetical protein B9Z55_005525 [Caenorhabditis nigoni]